MVTSTTKYMWHLGKRMNYRSTCAIQSEKFPGVAYTLRRVSLGARVELTEKLSDLARKVQFHRAGASAADQATASHLCSKADEIYLRWGLVSVSGLEINGEPATVESLIERGPDELVQGILERIRAECGLSAAERKNC